MLYNYHQHLISLDVFFFNDTATTEIYTEQIVGSVRCVQETAATKVFQHTILSQIPHILSTNRHSNQLLNEGNRSCRVTMKNASILISSKMEFFRKRDHAQRIHSYGCIICIIYFFFFLFLFAPVDAVVV
eukprot:TRINITY_DN1617_c0_g1_i12.p1 TRINITY_DN1617_c0_g1~~TRINITY_DN1617_c0_g1_i12.p1  ORF type:complete len:130 (-),score=2.77 TRINITY_DN1617_c0_g1_i12:68-457(-)